MSLFSFDVVVISEILVCFLLMLLCFFCNIVEFSFDVLFFFFLNIVMFSFDVVVISEMLLRFLLMPLCIFEIFCFLKCFCVTSPVYI